MVEFDPVGTISFFRERHRVETSTTGAVLHALPEHGLSFKAHPKSSSAGVIAWTIVRCLHLCNQLTETKTAEVSQQPHPEHHALVAVFEAECSSLSGRLASLNQRDWMEERSVTSGDRLLLRQPLGQILWLFHVDAIHHRGQLSTFFVNSAQRFLPSTAHPATHNISSPERPHQKDLTRKTRRSNETDWKYDLHHRWRLGHRTSPGRSAT